MYIIAYQKANMKLLSPGKDPKVYKLIQDERYN